MHLFVLISIFKIRYKSEFCLNKLMETSSFYLSVLPNWFGYQLCGVRDIFWKIKARFPKSCNILSNQNLCLSAVLQTELVIVF